MSKYIMRLDDACEKRDIEKWDRMEAMLDKYGIKPLVGVIPDCQDPMMQEYRVDENFWYKVHAWESKGWTIAMHGYQHVYTTECGGINPVNKRSEFAGETLKRQKEMIKKGYSIIKSHELNPKVFFAPSHTFDENTLVALREETDIRIISDTIANRAYLKYGFTFVPQQSGQCRKLPFKVVTFCYHPNTMSEEVFLKLERFLRSNKNKFDVFPNEKVIREESLFDKCLCKIYFLAKRIR